MSLDLTEDKSTLVQIMAWCRQATSLYLSQCWPRFVLPYGVIRPQWVNHMWLPNLTIVMRRSMWSNSLDVIVCNSAPAYAWFLVTEIFWLTSLSSMVKLKFCGKTYLNADISCRVQRKLQLLVSNYLVWIILSTSLWWTYWLAQVFW